MGAIPQVAPSGVEVKISTNFGLVYGGSLHKLLVEALKKGPILRHEAERWAS